MTKAEHLDPAMMAAYLDHGLAPAERERAVAHLGDCGECRVRLLSQIRAKVSADAADLPGRRRAWVPLVAGAAIGVLLVAAALWYALGDRGRPGEPAEREARATGGAVAPAPSSPGPTVAPAPSSPGPAVAASGAGTPEVVDTLREEAEVPAPAAVVWGAPGGTPPALEPAPAVAARPEPAPAARVPAPAAVAWGAPGGTPPALEPAPAVAARPEPAPAARVPAPAAVAWGAPGGTPPALEPAPAVVARPEPAPAARVPAPAAVAWGAPAGAPPATEPAPAVAAGPEPAQAAPEPAAPREEPAASRGQTRSVAGKTFRLQNGQWVDAAYRADQGAPRGVVQGTPAYEALLAREPRLARWSQIGPVLLVLDSTPYRILPRTR